MKKRFFPVPSKRLLLLLLIPLAGFIAGAAIPVFFKIALILDILIMVLALTDMLRIIANRKITVEANLTEKLSIGREHPLSVKFKRTGKIPLLVLCRFNLPRFLSHGTKRWNGFLEPNSETDLICPISSIRRGEFYINKLHIRLRTQLNLIGLYTEFPVDINLTVTPDLEKVKELFLLSRNNKLLALGIHKQKNRGQGYELDFLREYTQNDESRLIDWKASTRINKPLVKEFHLENTTEMIFLLDCGRFMISEEDNLSALDLAINSILVLSQMAVSMGDKIRIIPFSDKIKGDFVSSRGKSPLKNLINFLTPLQAEMVASDYAGVFKYIHEKVNKRSLLIFISDIVGNVNKPLWKTHFSLLSKRHTTLFMLLKDKLVQAEVKRERDTEEDIFAIVAARSLYMERNKMLLELKRSGVHVLDILPEEVTIQLVNKYLAFKSGMMGSSRK